jgi:hypothetical protein
LKQKPCYQQCGIAASAYVGQWMQSFKEMPLRHKTGSFKRNRVMNRSRQVPAVKNRFFKHRGSCTKAMGAALAKKQRKFKTRRHVEVIITPKTGGN